MKRPIARSLGSALLLGLLSFASVGCGEELADDSYGGLDLAPFFYDGSNPNNPTGGLPRTISPVVSFWEGRKAEFYDFGLVPVRQDRPDPNTALIYGINPTSNAPKFATVNPIYFFFDAQKRPMFSRPALEKRTWQFHMRGPAREGEPVLDPNPKEDADKRLAYPVRERAPWLDPKRQVADYQRPIIDVIQDDQGKYSGLWEVTLVIAPSGYSPDTIKSYTTLKKGIDAGDFKVIRTGRVINCPVLDDRTFVTPTTMDHDVPRPRMEVWYRRKLGSCFLVDGWEAIGQTRKAEDGNIFKDEYYLYTADEIEPRLNVMDVVSFQVGDGRSAVTQLFAPLGRLFVPRVQVPNQSGDLSQLRWPQAMTVDGQLPRRKGDDPPGYRPIRWAWDITVPTGEPNYRPDASFNTFFRAASRLDTSQITPRGSFTRNVPMLGTPVNCGVDPATNEPKFDADGNATGSKPLDPDPCPRLGLECPLRAGGPFAECSPPYRRNGEYCAPAVARCADFFRTAGGDPNAPQYDKAEGDFVAATLKPPPAGNAAGFLCHGGPNGTGHCYLRCNGNAANALFGQTAKIKAPETDSEPEREFDVPLDSRCGGESMPGYMCLPFSDVSGQRGGRMCLRACDPQRPIEEQRRLCQVENKKTVGKEPQYTDLDLAKATSCIAAGGFAACIKDVAFEPAE